MKCFIVTIKQPYNSQTYRDRWLAPKYNVGGTSICGGRRERHTFRVTRFQGSRFPSKKERDPCPLRSGKSFRLPCWPPSAAGNHFRSHVGSTFGSHFRLQIQCPISNWKCNFICRIQMSTRVKNFDFNLTSSVPLSQFRIQIYNPIYFQALEYVPVVLRRLVMIIKNVCILYRFRLNVCSRDSCYRLQYHN